LYMAMKKCASPAKTSKGPEKKVAKKPAKK
jgi:hypothetical protein